MTTDWVWLLDGYNDQNKTSLTEKEMLETVYGEKGSCLRAGDSLGICKEAFMARLKLHDIPLLPPGGIRTSMLDGMQVEGRDPKEVAVEAGCGVSNVYNYAKKHNIRIKRR